MYCENTLSVPTVDIIVRAICNICLEGTASRGFVPLPNSRALVCCTRFGVDRPICHNLHDKDITHSFEGGESFVARLVAP